MYTEEMLESIKKVEAKRAENAAMEPRRMTAEEKDQVLKENHPDYREDQFDVLSVGPNKGEKAPKELVKMLQSDSRLKDNLPDLSCPDYETDVLIIGGGGAGASAAIEADNAGEKVMIVTKLRIGDANTMMAEGGIQAADKPNDSPAQHFLDCFGGGHFAADKELVYKLVTEAPDGIQWLQDLGVEFDKDAEGNMITTHGGGTSRKRMHAAKDYSGAEIMRTLRDEVLNRKIPVVDFTSAIELIMDDKGHCAGAVLMNGVKRGLFSNEAGSGSAPCAAAAAECDDPVKMGFVQALGVLIDTVVICSCTAFLMLLVPQEITEGLAGMDLLQTALQYHLGGFGVVFIAATLALFSFSTFLGVLYYARGNVAYLCGDNWWSQTVYKLIALAMLVIGGMQAYTVVWDLGDVGIGLMTIFNMIALVPMAKEALAALNDYEKRKKLQ